MTIVNPESLTSTLDAVNEAFFYGRALSATDKLEAARWLAGLQGQGKWRTGFPLDAAAHHGGGVRLFTGEKLRTQFPGADVIGVEACRALMLLEGGSPDVKEALARANEGLRKACFAGSCIIGECAHGAVAVWRYLAVGGLDGAGGKLEGHLRMLAAQRSGEGRWQRLPFYYTLLALSEIDHPDARAEKQYAAPVCERLLNRPAEEDVIAQRRRVLMERILSQC